MSFGRKPKQVEDEAPVEAPEPTPETEQPEAEVAETAPREFKHDSYPP